jgi:hypothetical protein
MSPQPSLANLQAAAQMQANLQAAALRSQQQAQQAQQMLRNVSDHPLPPPFFLFCSLACLVGTFSLCPQQCCAV